MLGRGGQSMLGGNTILLPETGEYGANLLRGSLLYSKRVFVLSDFSHLGSSDCDEGWVQSGTGPYRTALTERLLKYRRDLRSLEGDLKEAQKAGLATSVWD